MEEQWREIPGYDYSVSDQGRVSSRKYGKWLVMKPARDSQGYLCISLCDGSGKKRTTKVHQLVVAAFLGPKPTPGHEINHIDGVKTNPRVDNLEWVTKSENTRHSYDVLGNKAARGDALPHTKVTETDVREIRRRCAAGESQRRVAMGYGITQSAVSLIVSGKNWAWLE